MSRTNAISKLLRGTTRFLWATPTLAHLQSIRRFELEAALAVLPARGRLLEIGAGTGWQAG